MRLKPRRSGRRLSRHPIGSLFVIVTWLLLSSGGTQALAAADAKSPGPSPQVMKGEVVMVTAEVCVVRDAAGKSVMFKVEKGTRIEGTVKEGRIVEVSASTDGVALSIKEVVVQ